MILETVFKNTEQAKQLMYVALIGIIICYACYSGKFDFLTGMATGLFSALGITQNSSKGEAKE